MKFVTIEPLFEWDQVKNLENILKHKVSFEDAQVAFLDPFRVISKTLVIVSTNFGGSV